MKRVLYWLPVFAWMTVIFLLSSRERVIVSQQQAVNFLFFKSLHVAEYAVLFVLTIRAVHNSFRTLRSETADLAAYLISLTFAATDEIHQVFVPTREGSPRDVIIDALGILIAWILIRRYAQTKLRKHRT